MSKVIETDTADEEKGKSTDCKTETEKHKNNWTNEMEGKGHSSSSDENEKISIPSAENIEQKEDCGLVENTSGDTKFGQTFEPFNETECLKFAEKLHKIVEELRISRINERDNELRIQKLMSEKSDLERLKDDEVFKNNELVQKCNTKQDEARKQFEEKLHSFQEDKTKHMLEKQSGEKEIKALKDEIRALHITKYTMEKLIKDQERQIQSHGANNTDYLTQLARLEKQCKDVFKQCSHIVTAIDKVEGNVQASAKLHKKLKFMNDHQDCILRTYKEKLEKRKQELISLEARQASANRVENDTTESSSLLHLQQELRMQKELYEQIQVQMNDTKQENQELIRSLNNAHGLLEKHVERNNKYLESEAIAQLELDELRTDCEKLQEALEKERSCAEEKDERLKEITTAYTEKERQQGDIIEKLTNENELLRKEKASLEELNTTWSQKSVEQKEKLEDLKKKVSELEHELEETKTELRRHTAEVERLEENLQNETTRHEEIIKQAREDNFKKCEESTKWRERAAELLQNERKMNQELEKLKSDEEIRKQQNQEIQTEICKTETVEKETNTVSTNCEWIITPTNNTDDKPDEKQSSKNDESSGKYLPIEANQAVLGSETNDQTKQIPCQDTTERHEEAVNTQSQRSQVNNSDADFHKYTQEQSVAVKKNIAFAKCTNETQPHMVPSSPVNNTLAMTTPSADYRGPLVSSPLYSVSKDRQTPSGDTSLEQSTPFKKRMREELASNKDACPGKPVLRNNNKVSEQKEQQSVETECIVTCMPTVKRTPLLAVVKPGTASQATRAKIGGKNSPNVPSHQATKGTSDTDVSNSRNNLSFEVLPTQPIQPEFREKPLKKKSKNSQEVAPLNVLELETSKTTEKQIVPSGVTETTSAITAGDMKQTNSETSQEKESQAVQANVISQKKQSSTPMVTQFNETTEKKDLKEANIAPVDDFWFSDEEEESMPRAIGSQIDRIEAFLKNDRLRLFRKRKTPDD